MGLRFSLQAGAALANLAPQPKRALRKALTALSKDPIGAAGLDVRLLDQHPGRTPIFRLSVGLYRAAYEVRRRDVYVVRVFHRRDGYGWLERL